MKLLAKISSKCCNSDYNNWLHIFIIALAIFILGVQVGIKQGRTLQIQDLELDYGIKISN